MSVNDHRTAPAVESFSVMDGSDDRSATFIFGNEDHTLGNSLRHVLMQRPEVDFCGYSVPHPYEPLMNLRLQVKEGFIAKEVLKAGLTDLGEVANIMERAFDDALKKFKK
jgi:DNA-directed RNA polymerases I and III subunit RPAC2